MIYNKIKPFDEGKKNLVIILKFCLFFVTQLISINIIFLNTTFIHFFFNSVNY